MKEKDLNAIIRKSFAEQGDFAFKIPDSGQYMNSRVTHTALPADGIAFYKGKFVMWESKWLSSPSSLDLQRLQDHQLESLKLTRDKLDSSLALFIVGIKWGARETRVYCFKDLDLIEERRINKNNIKKKEFETLTNYVTVYKGLVDVEEMIRKAL